MRKLAIVILVIGATTAGAWLGGETWLARQAERMITADPRIAAGAVTPLREFGRIGLNLSEIEMDTPEGPAALPSLELWAAPTSPTQFHAALPPAMTLPVLGRLREVAATDAALTLRLSPGAEMAISRLAAASGPVAVDGRPLLAMLDARAELAAMGVAAPRSARAAYRLDWIWRDLDPAVLLPTPPPLAGHTLSGEGSARVFLTAPLRQSDGAEPPVVVGFTSDGMRLALGDLALRVAGTVTADDDGRAQGAAFVYAADPRALIAMLAELGAVPQGMVALAGTALEQVARTPVDLPPGLPDPPEPEGEEQRIPLIFRDGRMFLGPLVIGDAPLFPV